MISHMMLPNLGQFGSKNIKNDEITINNEVPESIAKGNN